MSSHPHFSVRTIKIVLFSFVFSLVFFVSPAFSAPGPAPSFNLPTDNGNVSLDKLKGKVVYLDFWASWCIPCRKSFPWMKELQARYHDEGLVVVAVNLDKKKDKADEFLKHFSNNFIVAFDPDGKIAEKYKVMGMPSTYLINRKGQIALSHIGFRESDTDKLETKVRDLIKQ